MRMSAGQIAFGPFELDTEAPRLSRGGVEIELRPQALNALRALIQNTGRCVDYEEMIEDAWKGINVSRHTVAVTVGEVKKALREYGNWISYHPKLGYRLDIPQAEDLIRNGWHHWNRHTREGFEKAICCFGKALGEAGMEFRAYEGMARAYLMLGTFAMRPPREMHRSFREYHARAVALGGMTAELRGDLAQALHIHELRFSMAEQELHAAARENPQIAGTYIRLSVLYACMKRFDEAFDAVRQAHARDSLWPILPTAETLLHCCAGDFDRAVACGRDAVDLHPYLALGRSHLAQALEMAGRLEQALIEYRLAGTISPDLPRHRAEEARCLALMGRKAEARSILGELLDLSRREYVDDYPLALVYEALGETDETLRRIGKAVEDGSPHLPFMDVDHRLDALRKNPRFIKIRNVVYADDAEVPCPQTRTTASLPHYTPKEAVERHRAAS